MSAELLLREFARVGDRNVGQLRDFVLELAMQGRFSHGYDRFDESGADIAKRLRGDKASRSKARSSNSSGTDAEIALSSFPTDWGVATIDSICDLATGATPDSSRADYYGGEIKWLRSGDVNRRVIMDCEGRITRTGLENSNCKVLPPGCVLIALNGQGKTRGSVALLRTEAACNQSLVAIRSLDPASWKPEFIYWNLRSRYWAIRGLTGKEGDRRGLNMKLVGALPIAVPSAMEQERIVAKVEELMGLCDELEAAHTEREARRDRLRTTSLRNVVASDGSKDHARFFLRHSPRMLTKPEHIAGVRQAIFDLAVRGRLVAQNSQEGSPTAAMQAFGVWRAVHVTPHQPLRSRGLEYSTLPASWLRPPLGDLVQEMGSGWSPQCESSARTSDDQWAVLRTTAVQRLAFDPAEHKLLPRTLAPRPALAVAVDDVLMTRAGPKARVGISCVVNVAAPRLMISDKIIRFHPRPFLLAHYVALCLNAGDTAYEVDSIKSGMVVMQMNISQPRLRTVGIPLPPVEEQQRIVAKVDELMAVCDELEQSLATEQTERGRLLEAWLHDALEGGTVPELGEAAG